MNSQFHKVNKFCLLFVLNFSPFWTHANINWEELTEQIYQTPEAFELKAIGEGSTNSNYHLVLNEGHYFIRIAPLSSELLGASIEIEFEVLQSISELHISPQPIHLNRNRRILVTEFMQSAQEVDLSDPSTRHKVLSLLHIIEASKITISRVYQPYLNIVHLIDLAKSLNDPVCNVFNNEILPALKDIDRVLSQGQERTLCHFDLHQGNILKDNDRIWIVDWEYATMSDRFFTLGSMASTEHWDDDQMKRILKEYLPCFKEEDFHYLFLNRIVADIHWAAWCHIQKSLSILEMPYEEWENAYFTEALKRIRSPQYSEIIMKQKKRA